MLKGVKPQCQFPSSALCYVLSLEMALRMLMAFTYLLGFVTNLGEWTRRQVVHADQRR